MHFREEHLREMFLVCAQTSRAEVVEKTVDNHTRHHRDITSKMFTGTMKTIRRLEVALSMRLGSATEPHYPEACRPAQPKGVADGSTVWIEL